jgi:hypothetical protein
LYLIFNERQKNSCLHIPDFVNDFLQKLRKVQLPKFQDELEQRNFEQIAHYTPESTHIYLKQLLKGHLAIIKVVNGRLTKLGDFRPVPKGETPTITLNNNLNPYAFLVTFLHEWAHLLVYEQYYTTVRPHGKEWKNYFKMVMVPILEIDELPKEFKAVLYKHIKNPKASSLADPVLAKYLKQHDEKTAIHLEDLPANSLFVLQNGLILKKGIKRRTRYLCVDPKSKRQYTVHALAEVAEIKE